MVFKSSVIFGHFSKYRVGQNSPKRLILEVNLKVKKTGKNTQDANIRLKKTPNKRKKIPKC